VQQRHKAKAMTNPQRSSASAQQDYAAPPHLTIRSESDLKSKLLEAVNGGPAAPMTDADWDDMRRRLLDRHSQKDQ
jgi:hypothetical protein